MQRISSIDNFLFHPATSGRMPAGDPAAVRVDSAKNYSVDENYRNYVEPTSGFSTLRPVSGRPHSVASADLLAKMIEQMGGARRPSAKGTFVDISV